MAICRLPEHMAFLEKAVLSRFTAIHPDTMSYLSHGGTRRAPPGFFILSAGMRIVGRSIRPVYRGSPATFATLGKCCAYRCSSKFLIGNAGSPLRQALIDSGLGSALCDGSGYDAETAIRISPPA